MRKRTIKGVIKQFNGCEECPLHKTKHEYVWYRGFAPCDVLFIGEAPGKNEDLYGEPFIGRAGDVLDSWITDSVIELNKDRQLHNYTYGITNILACKPIDLNSKIRPPSKEEAAACSPRLLATISAANPRLIIVLGETAKKYHKIPRHLANIPVVHLKHPAWILRQGGIGSYAYDSNLLALVEALETYIYGTQEEAKHTEKPRSIGKEKTRTAPVKGDRKNQAVKVRSDQQRARKPRTTEHKVAKKKS